jgi:uncharacterized protein YndB with AHSA1/START domain
MMTDHSVAHGTFVIEREFPHPVSKVFGAWADPAKKAKWFGDSALPEVFEFRPGGRESRGGAVPGGGPVYRFDVVYQDIVENSRILYSYDMHLDDRKISVSLAAIEFEAVPGGTRLKVTEYGLYLDGLDNMEQRRDGTIPMIDALGAWLNSGEN